ncbi:type II secretion system F family protein [archaeon]|nr:type II secretion system F family protein [archaeon]
MPKLEKLGYALPPAVIRSYAENMRYAGIKAEPREYAGKQIAFSVLVFVAVLLLTLFLRLRFPIVPLAAVAAMLLSIVASYANLVLAADRRARKIEEVLPDALQLMSANVRAGMTVDKALWLSARPEFGEFESELRKMAADTLGGKSIAESMQSAMSRIKSVLFTRTAMLVSQGIALGGELANLLTEISRGVRQRQSLEKEIAAATSMYTVFILFASVLASPMLFAVSTFYVESTSKLWAKQTIGIGTGVSSSGSLGGVRVFQFGGAGSGLSGDEVRLFAVAAILITTFFGALTIGMVRHGLAKRGLKFTPVFVLVALAVYFIGYSVIRGMFGALIRG